MADSQSILSSAHPCAHRRRSQTTDKSDPAQWNLCHFQGTAKRTRIFQCPAPTLSTDTLALLPARIKGVSGVCTKGLHFAPRLPPTYWGFVLEKFATPCLRGAWVILLPFLRQFYRLGCPFETSIEGVGRRAGKLAHVYFVNKGEELARKHGESGLLGFSKRGKGSDVGLKWIGVGVGKAQTNYTHISVPLIWI